MLIFPVRVRGKEKERLTKQKEKTEAMIEMPKDEDAERAKVRRVARGEGGLEGAARVDEKVGKKQDSQMVGAQIGLGYSSRTSGLPIQEVIEEEGDCYQKLGGSQG